MFPEQTALGLLGLIKETPSTESTPVIVSLPEDPQLRVKVQNAFEGQAAGFVGKPYDGVEMAGMIDKSIGDDEMPSVNRDDRESVSLQAATALAMLDADHTQYDLASPQVLDALQATLANRDQAIRIQALHALGHSGDSARLNAVTDVYEQQDAQLSPELRSAFLYAIGKLNPTTESAQNIIKEALMNEDRSVRLAAANAVGYGSGLPASLLYQYQSQQRLDARSAGAGAE